MKNGIDFLAAGHVLQKDPYSYLSDIAWIDHEWLFEVTIAKLYQWAGVWGLTAFKLLVAMLTLSILTVFYIRSKLAVLCTCILVMFVFMQVCPWLVAPRPQIFDILFMSLVLIAISQAQDGNKLFMRFMPLIFVGWANVHGAFVAGLAIIFLWCSIDRVVSAFQLRSWRALFGATTIEYAAIFLASCLATLVNPYGLQLPVFLFKTMNTPRGEFLNWQPISLQSWFGKMYVLSVVSTAAAIFYTPRKRNLATIAIFLLLAVQPLSAMRHAFMVYLGAAILFAKDFQAIIDAHLYEAVHMTKTPWQMKVVLSVAMCIVSSFAFFSSLPLLSSIPLTPDLPIKAVSLLKNSGVAGNMAVDINWSDYCIWHLYPSIKVSMDPNRDSAMSGRVIAMNLKLINGILDWDELLKSTKTDIVLASRVQSEYNLMQLEPGWQLCYSDDICAIFAKKDSAIATALANSTPSPQPSYVFP